MSMNRFITTLIQLAFGIPTLWYLMQAIKDVKQNGFFPKDEEN